MDKKGKSRLTNEGMTNKFKNNFDLVNYAIKLAENMIKTGRDARVKSDVQNRAMLILEEINEGKDHFDDIDGTSPASGHRLDNEIAHTVIFEEGAEGRKYRTSETFDGEE